MFYVLAVAMASVSLCLYDMFYVLAVAMESVSGVSLWLETRLCRSVQHHPGLHTQRAAGKLHKPGYHQPRFPCSYINRGYQP